MPLMLGHIPYCCSVVVRVTIRLAPLETNLILLLKIFTCKVRFDS